MTVGARLDEDMRRHRREAAADGPDVEVVDVRDVRHREHRLGDLARLGGRHLEQDPRRVAQQHEARRKDQYGDDEARDRVPLVPAGRQHQRAGGGRPQERREIRGHVQERAADIEALAARARQHGGGDQADCGARERDDEHDTAAHVGRVDEAADRRVHDHDADHHQHDPVHVRCENLEPAEAERPASVGRPHRKRRRDQREPQSRRVGEHVAGVREQGEGPGDGAEDDLGGHQRDDQAERDRQRPLPSSMRVRVAHRAIVARTAAIRSGGVGWVKSRA